MFNWLKRMFPPKPLPAFGYQFGWDAALCGEARWDTEQYGPEVLRGYDDYWKSIEPEEL
jgi:hypothetical protein